MDITPDLPSLVLDQRTRYEAMLGGQPQLFGIAAALYRDAEDVEQAIRQLAVTRALEITQRPIHGLWIERVTIRGYQTWMGQHGADALPRWTAVRDAALSELETGRAVVAVLAERTGLEAGAVQSYLRVLHGAGIITAEWRRGRITGYRLGVTDQRIAE